MAFSNALVFYKVEFPATGWEAFGSGVSTAAGAVGNFARSLGILAGRAAYNLDRHS